MPKPSSIDYATTDGCTTLVRVCTQALLGNEHAEVNVNSNVIKCTHYSQPFIWAVFLHKKKSGTCIINIHTHTYTAYKPWIQNLVQVTIHLYAVGINHNSLLCIVNLSPEKRWVYVCTFLMLVQPEPFNSAELTVSVCGTQLERLMPEEHVCLSQFCCWTSPLSV